jgi:hypothetical protein
VVVGLDEGTVDDLLAAADRVEVAFRFEAVRGLTAAAARGLRAVGVAAGGAAF